MIAVCKKLTRNQSEYNSVAASLGADYRWMYDSSCTHFIFQVCLLFFTSCLTSVISRQSFFSFKCLLDVVLVETVIYVSLINSINDFDMSSLCCFTLFTLVHFSLV